MTITHSELVAVGAKWLFNTKRFPLVVTEFAGGAEIPDVLGWHGWNSTEIEVKVTLSDFRADRHKTSRRIDGRGIALHRYYLVPEALVVKIEGLLLPGWGLLYLHHNGRTIKIQKESAVFEVDRREDLYIYQSIIRRIAGKRQPLHGIQVRCYTDNSWMERERLILQYDRDGLPVDEAEIARKLRPRARLLVKAEM